MSRIGKLAIPIPDGVEISVDGQKITVKGKLGNLSLDLPKFLRCQIKEGKIQLVSQGEGAFRKAHYGLYRSLLNNSVIGCSKGFEKKLKIHGVGYGAKIEGEKLILNVGFSHPVELTIPENLRTTVQKNIITVSGIDKQKVGQFAAQIRSVKKPDAYKGRGIRYLDEIVRTKPGKIAKTVGA
jgi:large subunit ribosomal protein L6